MLKLIIITALVLTQAIGIDNSHILNEEKIVSIDGSEEIIYDIEKDNTYIFQIKNENYLYSFISDTDDIFYTKNENENYEHRKNATFFENEEKVYVNPHSNISKSIKITISPVPIYKTLNSFETLNENQNFFIKSTEKSIVYFGSFDRNSKTYISEISEEKILNQNYTRINDKFQEIEPDKLYHIKNNIYDISVFNKYFYPLNLEGKTINITDDEINFLYLEKNNNPYILDFSNNKMNKTLKLSIKTFNSKIKLIKNDEDTVTEIDRYSPYYPLTDHFNGELKLKIEEEAAFIEFLSNEGDPEILNDISKDKHLTKNDRVIINIGKTQKSFELSFKSNQNFKYSLSLGLNNEEKYYYSSKLNSKINSEKKEETFSYLALFKNIDLLEDEFLSYTINFEKEKEQNIEISYKQYSLIDELLDEDVPDEKAEKIIKGIQEALDFYIYLDIAKNPPEFPGYPNYHHRKVDLKDEIGKISAKNRKYYEFYQEIEKILFTTRDLHFLISSYKTNKNIQFNQYYAYLPFNFIIKKYGEKNETRIFITKRDEIKDFDEKIQNFVDSHLDIPVKSINDIEPFEYIQNWSQYRACKSKHCQFVYMLKVISGFYLLSFPLDYSSLILNEYEFEDDSILRIPYLISKPELNESKEFNNYFLETIKNYNKHSTIFPSINEIKEKYLISKGLKKKLKMNELKNDKIEWDISFIDEDSNYFKCKVDHKNKVNVFVQNSFYIAPYLIRGKLFDCAIKFHSNNYPLIIIETLNGGGYPYLSLLLIQLFQMRATERTFSSYGTSEATINYFDQYEWGLIKPDTCEIIDHIKDLEKVEDFYDSDKKIKHIRTIPTISILSKIDRQALNDLRKDYEKSQNLKRPTDIIIYTDGYSYSATSTFIKGFQHIGGAITVGYFGNPKIKGTDLFDASQADSGVYDFEGTDIYNNLSDLGFIIYGITGEEVFDGTIIDGKEFPREYTIIPVDYRVDIYSEYSDHIYNEFVSEGLKIFNSVNNDKSCNSKNDRLLFHDEECDVGIEHGYGGYRCGENGKWDESKCVPYYCDIGYSLDIEKNKCEPDCISDISEVKYILESDYENEFIADNKTSYVFIPIRYPSKYLFQTSGDYITDLPRFTIIDYYSGVFINKDKNAENDFLVKIKEIDTDFQFLNYKGDNLLFELLLLKSNKQMLILQFETNHVLCLNNILNLESNKLKYLIYNDKISYKDILDLNEKYFQDFKGDFFHMKKNELYIIYFDYNSNYLINPIYYSINSIENETISYKEGGIDYLYLQKNKNYEIEFSDDYELEGVLKLSKQSLNSEIIIDDNLVLNKKNNYYKFQTFNKTLKIKAEKEDVFIEFMWNITVYYDIDNLDFQKSEFNLTHFLNIIKIPRKKEYKNITFEVKGEQSLCIIHQEYSVQDYYHNLPLYEESLISLDNFTFSVIEPYKDIEQLRNDEYFYVLIILTQGSLNLKKIVEMNDNKKDDKLKGWHIALIIVGSLLLISLIVIIIILIKRKYKQLSSDKIEEKIVSLTSI